MKKNKYKKLLFLFLIISIFGLLFFGQKKNNFASAGNGDNVFGFAWSENIGWISFNSTDCDIDGNGTFDDAGAPTGCPSSGTAFNYGVTIDGATGNFSGYAWSENVGWIYFGPDATLSGYGLTQESDAPEAPKTWGNYDSATGAVTGWAKILALGDDGWINLESNSSNGLLLYQSFNAADISGTTAIDRSGEGNDGIITGATAASGKFNEALDFNGSSDYVDFGAISSLNGSPEMTVSVWINPQAGAGSNDGIFIKFNDWGNYIGIRYNTTDLQFEIVSGGDYSCGVYGIPVSNAPNGSWTHLSYTYNRGFTEAYINGVSVGTRSCATILTVPANNGDWLVGSRTKTADRFDGLIEEAQIYNRALSNNEISFIFSNGGPLGQVGATIDSSTGEFSGWAWNGNAVAGTGIGWISFNCADTSSCGTSDYKVTLGSAPNAPTINTIEDLVCSYGDPIPVKVNWTDNSDNEASFETEQSLNGIDWTSHCTRVSDAAETLATGVSRNCSGYALENTPYDFRVKAINGTASSTWSTTLSPHTTGFCIPDLTAGENANCDLFDLEWGYTDNTGVDEYGIYRDSGDGSGFVEMATTTPNTPGYITAYTDTDITSDTTYSYKIEARYTTHPADNKTSNTLSNIKPCPSLPTWREVKP